MQFCCDEDAEQFILHPDTSAVTQMHDQVNARLHAKYEESKKKMYSSMASLNREDFMQILADCYGEWASPEKMVNAARRVGISKDGLNINWMQQLKLC